jgi:hypothetical protein
MAEVVSLLLAIVKTFLAEPVSEVSFYDDDMSPFPEDYLLILCHYPTVTLP